MKCTLTILILLFYCIIVSGQKKELLVTIKPPKTASDILFVAGDIIVDKDSLVIDVNKIESVTILKIKRK
ncbi:MAG: hypothetical protein LBG19_10910 [Prevotellaceae bacterium]|jgi:hypothetical protein|nr:hypothetical protein [Prevotellaceae bacterium]